jgi:hypothetical protein
MCTAVVGLPSLKRASPLLLLLVAAPALGSDNTEGLDECLASARELHEGLPTRWEVEDGSGRGFEIELVSTDGRVWKMQCPPTSGKATIVGRGIGIQDYATMNARAKVAEQDARNTVRTYFPGRFIEMVFDLTWRGGAIYAYTVITPDDRESSIEVDAATGRIVRSKSKAVD